MRILITGVTGFVGGHLVELLKAEGETELAGTARHLPPSTPDPLTDVQLHACDLADPASTEQLLREVRPEQIYHLAGYADVGRSFQEVEAAWAGNLQATRTLYDAVQRVGSPARILFVGSALVYGDLLSPEQCFTEDSPLQPVNPYAASKAAADLASYQYTRFPGLDIVRVRPFNHIGPRQPPAYAVAHFARQLAAIELGLQQPLLETGNLAPRRDFTDVRDIVRAYRLLMKGGQRGAVYNVATGTAHSMQEVLERLLALTRVQVEVRPQARLVRAAEVLRVAGDSTRLRRETGWTPQRSLETSLADILNYWRTQLRRESA
jgi:GDP-4-dehydro-6-deoxy-D-mannose reductase